VSNDSSARRAGVFRQDVRSMHAYAIQDSRGLVKLDAMENPFRLPDALQKELGERLGRVPRPASATSSRRSRATSSFRQAAS
jgi:histidinol-phosphate aminotransferase